MIITLRDIISRKQQTIRETRRAASSGPASEPIEIADIGIYRFHSATILRGEPRIILENLSSVSSAIRRRRSRRIGSAREREHASRIFRGLSSN